MSTKTESGHQGVGRSDNASDHPNATRAQDKAQRKEFEVVVWKGTLAGKTLRQIADETPGLSKSAAHRMKIKSLRRRAKKVDGMIDHWTALETARAEDRTCQVNDILSELPTAANALVDLVDLVAMRIKCIDQMEKISARLAKLLGLDATKLVLIEKQAGLQAEDMFVALIEALRDSGNEDAAVAVDDALAKMEKAKP